jgi:hypothetical protein
VTEWLVLSGDDTMTCSHCGSSGIDGQSPLSMGADLPSGGRCGYCGTVSPDAPVSPFGVAPRKSDARVDGNGNGDSK